MLSALDRKLLRDLARLWAQVVAVALVMACGVMTIVFAFGTNRSLEETRAAFYQRSQFATVFADLSRAPKSLVTTIRNIDGVSAVEPRIVKQALLDIQGMVEPASAITISIPPNRALTVNRLYLRGGRLPEASRPDEVAVVDSFAQAHGFKLGDRFKALLNGQKQTLRIVGIVLSPEFIYAIGPGDMVPDPKRFGIVFMGEDAMASIFDFDGAFNSVVITTQLDAGLATIIERLDSVLEAYGGTGAIEREDQTSNAFLDAELEQLAAMAAVIPPIFLFISAFLVNMILSRLIALEREQIGLMKAVGYSDLDVGWHYTKMVVCICAVGIFIGSFAGWWMGNMLTRLYGQFFSFPYLVFAQGADLYVIASAVTIAAAVLGAARAIWSSVALAPAVAMRPPAPPGYHDSSSGLWIRFLDPLSKMSVRHLVRWPFRSLLTGFGTSLSVALLVTALFSFDAIDHMIDTIFFQTQRQDATLTFTGDKSPDALTSVERLPGVMRVEGFSVAAATLRNGHRSQILQLSTIANEADLTRVIGLDGLPIRPPDAGLVLSERVAEKLGLRAGDKVDVELMNRDGRTETVTVVALAESLVGLTAYIHDDALRRLLRTGPQISGAHVYVDDSQLPRLYGAVKETPGIASIALLGLSRDQFRATIRENIVISITVYVTLAVIITFGVIYNAARIQLSERARELASLRVFGFTRGEVSSVLLSELAIIVILSQPFGWLLGYGLSYLVSRGFESDLFRIPLIVNTSTFATASLVVMAAALLSALIVRRRIDRLDLVRVLKTRD